ncbi:MAG: tRNA pseudouridine(38-40) synthase TruA [Pseudomonadales bacterium]|nr:tRNA pseudouridine(38-40) synthase TruA [Gammaproteobacteria bacterium]NNL56975.1 tRNA pseudouridine(38-40) synthase TruA [Pseudomonadales bacterium]
MSQRIAIGVEYNGQHFHGWQRQATPALPTVQGALEGAIARVANHPVRLVCAGRTDAGVHACGQVAHFDVAVDRGNKAWIAGVNSALPRSVRVIWAAPVNTSFHARFVALARQYQYWIHNSRVAPGIFAGQLAHCVAPLDAVLMHSEAQSLCGEQDFSSFRAAGCESRHARRNVLAARVFRRGDRVCLEISANAFLLHMVRNIAGSLMVVGSGVQHKGWIRELLDQRDRRLAAATASPAGLYLQQVFYPAAYALPESGAELFGG